MYRVKLYGCTGHEPEMFARFLAATLEIDPDRAQEIIRSTPVVVAETSDPSKAETLKILIESRNGLCLVESDSEVGDEGDTYSLALSSFENTGPTPEARDDSSRPLLRPSWLAGATALIVAAGFVWLLSGSPQNDGQGTDAETPKQHSKSIGENAEAVIADSPINGLREEVRRLEKRANDLKVQVQWHQEELLDLYNRHSTDYEDIRLKKFHLQTAQVELALVLKALQNKKDRLKAVGQVRSEH